MAGDNRQALISVLEHFKAAGNMEKLKAAEFLIANLPYNFSYDTTSLHKYRPIYEACDSFKNRLENRHLDINLYINPRWDSLRLRENPHRNIYSMPVIEDIKIISSDFLIATVEQAYAAWKNNPYSRDSVGFDDFCEHILPYRQVQGNPIENWRTFFVAHNEVRFPDLYPIPFTAACDAYSNSTDPTGSITGSPKTFQS